MKKDTDNKNGGDKSSNRGSYPYCSLSKSLEVADAVRDLGGAKAAVDRSLLAAHLESEEKSTTFAQIIGAAKCFGLIDGRSAYTLTELAQQYYFPTNENQRRDALLRIICSPEAYQSLISRFDGSKLPSNELLANLMHREFNVPKSWMIRIASMFNTCLRDAGVVDGANVMRYAAAKAASARVIEPLTTVVPPAEERPHSPEGRAPETPSEVNSEMDVWSYGPRGANVRLETGKNLTLAVWNKLNQYIQVLKPTDNAE